MKKQARIFFQFFMNGLLLLAPFAGTIFVALSIFRWLDGLIQTGIPGLGLIILVIGITVFGYLGSMFLFRPIWVKVEEMLGKAPLVSLIYNSIKDLASAFMGDKKKFNQAVMVDLGNGCWKPGFVTQSDIPVEGLNGMVSVYFPHSYNFSGNVFFVSLAQVKNLDVPSTDFMKFIVSGGIVPLEKDDETTQDIPKNHE
ncbi:MAG: DUF502 domain-containing protein [Bacteroidota bacterium]